MVRITNGFSRHARHKKFVDQAKGFRLGRKNVYKQVRLALVKQGQNAYKGRKAKKRDFRKLWIERLSAAVRARHMRYSEFIGKMREKNVQVDRKMLSNIAVMFPQVFDEVFTVVAK